MGRALKLQLFPAILAAALLLGSAGFAAAQAPELGRIEFPTSASGVAQEQFLRGVAALHSFWYEEALEAFEAATREDPDFALGYWGQAMAHNHPLWDEQNAEAARAALGKVRDSAALTPRERGFIHAVRALYGEGDKVARNRAYSLAMEQLYREFPGDHEVAGFYALSLLGQVQSGEKGYRRQARAGAIALEVFAQNPLHPGAAHYIIHSFDDPEHAILALPAARRYAGIAPQAHHARHMPSHIFIQLGMWPEAAASNESAWAASVAWAGRSGNISRRDFHSLHWMLYIFAQQGRYARAREALETLRQTAGGGNRRSVYYWSEMVSCYLMESERWDAAADLFALATSPAGEESHATHQHVPQGTAGSGRKTAPERRHTLEAYARGMAAASRGSKEAATHARQLREMRARMREAGESYQARIAEILELEIAAQLHASQKKYDTALAEMMKATRLEEELSPPSGPPEVLKPSHELAGEILLRAGRAEEAAQQFELALLRQPNRARSLLGSARAAAKSGNAAAAAAAYARLIENWKDADAQLPELAEAREFVRQQGMRVAGR